MIHFNWGLHDLKRMGDGKHQVPPDEYEKNLRELVGRLKKTGGDAGVVQHNARAGSFQSAAIERRRGGL